MIHPRLLLPWLLLALSLAACSSPEPESPLSYEHRFELSLNGHTAYAQVAITPEESAQGLMHREKLEPDEGMLFVFPTPRRASFWMKNTPLPLDIGYFSSEGILLEIHRLFPFDETSVTSSRADVQFALEMNQGWFSKNGIRPGARLSLDDIRTAIVQRGFEPERFNL